MNESIPQGRWSWVRISAPNIWTLFYILRTQSYTASTATVHNIYVVEKNYKAYTEYDVIKISGIQSRTELGKHLQFVGRFWLDFFLPLKVQTTLFQHKRL